MWREVETVMNDNKRELCLSGKTIGDRIESGGLDQHIFKISNLNLLRINDARVQTLPEDISFLLNLQSLMLYGNKIEKLPDGIQKLQKLKLLDVSRNKLREFDYCVRKLFNIETINFSSNSLSSFPTDLNLKKITVLNMSYNKIVDISNLCQDGLASLTNLNLKSNLITIIPIDIVKLNNLKVLDLSLNKIEDIPKALGSISKLKELDLGENPIANKRLLKIVKQCRTKQVIDYIKVHGSELPAKHVEGSDTQKQSPEPDFYVNTKLIHVTKYSNDVLTVIYDANVKVVRPFFICCIIRNLKLNTDTLKKFLQLQCKIHDTICGKREKSVIATHDLALLKTRLLVYTAKDPNEIFICPLGKTSRISGAELYSNLKSEAEVIRREKKRNAFTSIHKFLYLLERKSKYTCLEDPEGNVFSLHPLTNSEISKISISTTDIFVEVSSCTDMRTCRATMEMLITEMHKLLIDTNGTKFIIQQVKVTDKDGNLKTVYPSKNDLQLETPFLVETDNF